MIAQPHMPDRVVRVRDIAGMKISQCCIGSCTNSSLMDMIKVGEIMKGKTVHPDVSLAIAPGSKQVLNMIAANGELSNIIDAGARILESACGPCIGMGQSPRSAGISLRTFNRNFKGRSGTADAGVYLVSPETAAASALTGVLTDPRDLGEAPTVHMPASFTVNDNMVELPYSPAEAKEHEVEYGPNIKDVPKGHALEDEIDKKVVLKVGDDITTDHIMPAGAKILPFRSNVPRISDFCFTVCDERFPERCKEMQGGFIVGGLNYGQGSSREHAALAPLYLGVRAVLVKSFSRMHKANLINSGILPLVFMNPDDYDTIDQGDELILADIRAAIEEKDTAVVRNITKGLEYTVGTDFSARQRAILLAGGCLNYIAQQK